MQSTTIRQLTLTDHQRQLLYKLIRSCDERDSFAGVFGMSDPNHSCGFSIMFITMNSIITTTTYSKETPPNPDLLGAIHELAEAGIDFIPDEFKNIAQ